MSPLHLHTSMPSCNCSCKSASRSTSAKMKTLRVSSSRSKVFTSGCATMCWPKISSTKTLSRWKEPSLRGRKIWRFRLGLYKTKSLRSRCVFKRLKLWLNRCKVVQTLALTEWLNWRNKIRFLTLTCWSLRVNTKVSRSNLNFCTASTTLKTKIKPTKNYLQSGESTR